MSRKSILEACKSLTDSVLGIAFTLEIGSRLEKAFLSDLFKMEFQFQDKTKSLDKLNKMGSEKEKYLSSDSITPYTDFSNFIHYDKSLRFEYLVGAYRLSYDITVNPSFEWKKSGEFKFILKEKEGISKCYKNGYRQILSVCINLSITDADERKEYYQKILSDSCLALTIMDMDLMEDVGKVE